MSQAEQRELEKKLLETDLKIRRLVVALLKKSLNFRTPSKRIRNFWLLILSIIVGCPTLVAIIDVIAGHRYI